MPPPTPNQEHHIRLGTLTSYIYWILLKVSELVLIVLSGLLHEEAGVFFSGGGGEFVTKGLIEEIFFLKGGNCIDDS